MRAVEENLKPLSPQEEYDVRFGAQKNDSYSNIHSFDPMRQYGNENLYAPKNTYNPNVYQENNYSNNNQYDNLSNLSGDMYLRPQTNNFEVAADNVDTTIDQPKQNIFTDRAKVLDFINTPLSGEELVNMMKLAKECGAATSLDFASIDPNSEAGAVDWEKLLERVLPHVDFFVPSVEELCFMLDKERFYEWQERAAGRDITEILDIEKDVKPLADQCMDFGAKVLLIKCGAPGMYYRTADKLSMWELCNVLELSMEQWADKEGFEKSYKPELVLSGTGAGDTSIAAFLTAALEGYSLKKALQLATATGASCVETYDALSGLKSFEELQTKIDAGWKKNE